MQQKISDVFGSGFVVKRRLTHAERKRFLHITRGVSPLVNCARLWTISYAFV